MTDERSEQPKQIRIEYATPEYFPAMHEALGAVAQEGIYIEQTQAPPLSSVVEFQGSLVERNAPVFYAFDGEKLIGWIDITPHASDRFCHRGSLGMGLVQGYRGLGIGSALVKAALEHARKLGLEKVELHVYSTNTAAIALYSKFGFEVEGLHQRYRKFNGQTFDCLSMAILFPENFSDHFGPRSTND